MKKVYKILLVLALIVLMLSVNVYAAKSSGYDPSGYTGKNADVGKIEEVGQKVIQIVTTIGSIASVIVLVVLGLKYMMGSAEEKAEYKKTLLPYIIGAAFVFAAASIASAIYGFTHGL